MDRRPPICLVDGWCRRKQVSITRLEGSPDLVRPEQIDCSVLIVNTCFGILHSDGPIDFRWSLFGAICESANFLAAAFHLHLKEVAGEDIRPLIQSLEAGKPLGVAFGAAVQDGWSARFAFRFILVGEPSCSVGPNSVDSNFLPSPEDHPHVLRVQPRKLRIKKQAANRRRHKYFVRQCFESAAFANVQTSKATNVAQCIQQYSREIWPNAFSNYSGAIRLLIFLCSTKLGLYPLFTTRCEGFTPRAIPYGTLRCRTCAKVAHGRLFEHVSGVQRLVVRCESCGAIYDQVVDHDVSMKYDSSRHELVIDNPDRIISSACIYVPATGTATSIVVQPIARPLLETRKIKVALDSALPVRGPRMLGLAYFSGSRLGTISIDVLVNRVAADCEPQ